MSALNRWFHKVHDIPRTGIKQHREASPELCAEIAKELEVPGCHELIADYRIRNAGRGRFELSGWVSASFTRTCVVSLEPIEETVREPLDCAFVPSDQLPASQADEEEALSVEDLEPISHDKIEAGRIIYETIAASIDPYPRAPDATLDTPLEPGVDDAESPHPFAALARLKASDADPS
ncbi:MAG: DUF177 domain-containing protein [Alphaproteobacteria bacterium]|nr:DUF177 domain-containing protein [Alphaproteobacteria bacterium]